MRVGHAGATAASITSAESRRPAQPGDHVLRRPELLFRCRRPPADARSKVMKGSWWGISARAGRDGALGEAFLAHHGAACFGIMVEVHHGRPFQSNCRDARRVQCTILTRQQQQGKSFMCSFQ